MTHDPQTYQLVQERFQREAAVLEELGEGNNQIPKLYAYFSEAGQFYLVQEWIEGDTLTKKVEQGGRLSDTEVKQILVSLLPVLDYVHSRHMVHRDIKPDNIIIRKRDGLPVLIDFGAVKEAMNTVVVNQPGNSAQSMVIGTPGFMPSEQAGGRPTYSSDLYSLGLSAVFLLTGKMPQELETDARTGEFLWRQYAGNINSNLAMVIDRAIRFNPRDRFASAKEMLNALQSSQSGDAVSQMATVAVSPGGLPQARNNSTPPIASPSPPQTVPVGTNPIIQSNNGSKPWIIGALIAGGVLLTAVAIAVGLKRSPEPSSSVASSPQPASEQPTTEQPSSPTPLGSPSHSANSEPPLKQSTTQEPSSPIPSPSKPLAITPSPIPSEPFSVRSPQAPSPEPIQFPSPTPGNNNQTPSLGKSIPGFAPGTQRQAVEVELGSPTKVSKGVWPNTRAVLYEEFVPNQVSLGYLFDRNSGRLRQTEASFAQSVELKTMSQTLEKMLSGNASADIQQGLQAVYQGKSNRYKFASGRENSLKGVIERNERDRIYMAVWEADLH